MPYSVPTWVISLATGISIVLVALVGVWLVRKDKKEADALIVKTNPDDPAGIADIDRMQDDGKLHPES